MAPLNGAIGRRLRGRLPADDVAAMSAGSPFAEPTQDVAAQDFAAPDPADVLRGARVHVSPTGRITLAPDVGGDEADMLGRRIGQAQVASRLQPPGAGLGLEGLGVRDDFNLRARDIGRAVKRRLEELTGAAPDQPTFASPVRRGRFGF